MKTKLLALPVLFLAISALQGCGDNKNEITADMLIGEWDCAVETAQLVAIDNDTGELDYIDDENYDALFSKLLFEKVTEYPNFKIKMTGTSSKNKEYKFVKVSYFDPEIESITFYDNKKIYNYFSFDYVNKNEFKLNDKRYMIYYGRIGWQDPIQAEGKTQTLKCTRKVK